MIELCCVIEVKDLGNKWGKVIILEELVLGYRELLELLERRLFYYLIFDKVLYMI